MKIRIPLKFKIRIWKPPKIRVIWPKIPWPTLPKLPTLRMPELSRPRLRLHDVKVPQVRLPQMSLPKLNVPRVEVPKVTLPELRLPDIQVPKLERPKVALPVFKVPEIKVPNVCVPEMRTPQIRLPQLRIPEVRWPQIRLPDFRLPQIQLPKLPRLPRLPRLAPEHLPTAVGILVCAFIFTAFQTGFGQGTDVWAARVGKIDDVVKGSLVQIDEAVRGSIEHIAVDAHEFATIEPASGTEILMDEDGLEQERFAIENQTISVEAVLVPNENTVISSSKDGKIHKIHFDNGEIFRKGDILVEYACKDLRAELDIAQSQQKVADTKKSASMKLFKLDIISNIEKLELESESDQAQARSRLYESRMEACYIRADYDGRVVKKLANASEFTRTDRVLMEVASLDYLKAEFLLPSRWLRWVNVGAPVVLEIDETERSYSATIRNIYGEVDPVSRSIQMTAQLDPYGDPLLPGMSGQLTLDIESIRNAGIFGFLEQKPEDYRP